MMQTADAENYTHDEIFMTSELMCTKHLISKYKIKKIQKRIKRGRKRELRVRGGNIHTCTLDDLLHEYELIL